MHTLASQGDQPFLLLGWVGTVTYRDPGILDWDTSSPLCAQIWDTQSCTCDSSVSPFFQDPLLPRRMLQEASGPGDGQAAGDVRYTVLPSCNAWVKGPHYHPIVTDEKAVP